MYENITLNQYIAVLQSLAQVYGKYEVSTTYDSKELEAGFLLPHVVAIKNTNGTKLNLYIPSMMKDLPRSLIRGDDCE